MPSWATANYQLNPDAQLPTKYTADITLRQSMRLSIGGKRLRIVVSNAGGEVPLIVTAASVAFAVATGSPAILPQSALMVSFGGRSGVVVAPGAVVRSDPIALTVPPLAHLAISMHLLHAPAPQTGHLRSLTTSWIAHGSHVTAVTLLDAEPAEHWYQLAAVEVDAANAGAIAVLGDSITDGSRSVVNSDTRWPDLLAERLAAQPEARQWGIANLGIAGNRLLADGYGRSALARFDNDVLAIPHLRTIVLLEGTNDLGQSAAATRTPTAHRARVRAIADGYAQLILRAHARGIRIVGATIPPFGGSDYRPTTLDDRDRRSLNAWIKAPGHFDAVIDWDRVLRDPASRQRLKSAYDSGDHLHPSSAGYRAMANAIPLGELTKGAHPHEPGE